MRPERVQKGPMQVMAKDIKGKAGADQELIRELAQLLDETGLSEIEIDRDGVRVRVARQLRVDAAAFATVPASAPQAAPATALEAKSAPADPVEHPGCV